MFLSGIVAAGVLSLHGVGTGAGEPSWPLFALLAAAAVGANGIRLRLPSADRTINPAWPLCGVGVLLLPAFWAWAVCAAAATAGRAFQTSFKFGVGSAGAIAFDLGVSAAAVSAATFGARSSWLEASLPQVLGGAAAAAAFFLVWSCCRALYASILAGSRPWHIWRRQYAPLFPVSLLAPAAAIELQLLILPRSPWDTVIGLGVLGLASWHVRSFVHSTAPADARSAARGAVFPASAPLSECRTIDLDLACRAAALRRLSERPDHLVAFFEILSDLGKDLTLDEALRAGMARLAETCRADTASVFRYESDASLYVLETGVGLSASAAAKRVALPAGLAIVESAVALRAARHTGSSRDIAALASSDSFAAAQSALAAPLVSRGRTAGVLLLTANRAAAFDAAHVLLANLLSPKLAATLYSAQELHKLRQDAHTDAATSLPNARAAFARLEEEINRALRESRPLALLFIDLNDLKRINDSYGHAAGNKVLAATASRLRGALRSYDFVGRVGGDEFLALLPGAAAHDADRIAALLKGTAAQPVPVERDTFVSPTVSVGAAHCPSDGIDPAVLFSLSDQRMYDDKRRAKGTAAPAARGSRFPAR